MIQELMRGLMYVCYVCFWKCKWIYRWMNGWIVYISMICRVVILVKSKKAYYYWVCYANCWRSLGKISRKDHVTKAKVCEILKTKPELLNKVKTRNLQYFGHFKQHYTIQKQKTWKQEGTRSRVKQRTLWTDNIKQ